MSTSVTRTRRSIVVIIAGILLALGSPAVAWADATDDLVAVDENLSAALDDFIAVYSDQSTSTEEVTAAADAFEDASTSAQQDFRDIADAEGGDIARFAGQFADEAGDMSTATNAISAAFAAQDPAALTQAENDLQAAFDAYDKTADEYNTYLKTAGDPSYVGWLILLIVAVVFLVLALLFALLTRKQTGLLPAKADKKGNLQQSSLARLRWMVVVWAGLFVVGAAIPFFQVAFAQPDASGNYTYRVFWYPLAAGAILTIVGVVQYFIAAGRVRREGSAEPIGGAVPSEYAPMTPAPGWAPPSAADPAPVAPPAAEPSGAVPPTEPQR